MDAIKVTYYWTAFDSLSREIVASGQFFGFTRYDEHTRVDRERRLALSVPNRTFVCIMIDEDGSEEIAYDSNGVS